MTMLPPLQQPVIRTATGRDPELYPLLVCTLTVPLTTPLGLVIATSTRTLTSEVLVLGATPCWALP
jgi:hypothetical protein